MTISGRRPKQEYPRNEARKPVPKLNGSRRGQVTRTNIHFGLTVSVYAGSQRRNLVGGGGGQAPHPIFFNLGLAFFGYWIQ
jgi:hypothetical protein